MIKVKKIDWCCLDEADVEVTDGQFSLICFCYPCKLVLGQIIEHALSPLEPYDVFRSDEKEHMVEKLAGFYNYRFVGQLIDKARGIVKVGGFYIDIGRDSIPKDIHQDEFIEFKCDRLSV